MLQIFAIIDDTSVMNFRKNLQHNFPKMRRGRGVKGRLELFRKVIRFGDVRHSLANTFFSQFFMSMSYPLLLNMIFLCIKFFVHSSFNLNFKGKSMILIKCNLRQFSSSYISISRTLNAGSRSSTRRLHLADS